jgi:hypothetical protein
MKIGIFGDSFADKNWQSNIWWRHLSSEFGHNVQCFGEGGSSILFSAQKIQQYGQQFDLVIWALTSPNRISFEHETEFYHVNSVDQLYNGNNLHVKTQFQAAHDYLTYLHNWDDETLVGKSLVYYLQQTLRNILIVPCFPPPMSAKFNLYNLCEWEADFYFPNKSIPEIYREYQDLRAGHLTDENNRILAKLINNQLTPGIFQTDYNNFVTPTSRFDCCFKKF